MSSKKTKAPKIAPIAPAAPIELPDVPAPATVPAKPAARKKAAAKAPAAPEAAIADALASFEASQIEQVAAVTQEPAAPEPAALKASQLDAPAADPSPAPDANPTPTTPPKVQKAKAAATTNPRALGCLDAAAIVLAEANVPMNCKVLTGDVLTRGLWTTLGRTPEATLYAAIIREIAAKGENSRFIKTDRGLFAINPAIAPATASV